MGLSETADRLAGFKETPIVIIGLRDENKVFLAYRIYDYAQNSQYVVSKLGSTGDEVNKIQKKLSSLGFYNGSVDGVYGNDTKSAVKAFQKS